MCYIYWLRVTYKHFRWTRVFPTHTHTNNTCNGKHLHFNKIQWNFGSWHFWHNLTCNLLTCLNKRNPFKMHSIPLIHRNHCDIDRFVRLKKWSFYRDLWYRWKLTLLYLIKRFWKIYVGSRWGTHITLKHWFNSSGSLSGFGKNCDGHEGHEEQKKCKEKLCW